MAEILKTKALAVARGKNVTPVGSGASTSPQIVCSAPHSGVATAYGCQRMAPVNSFLFVPAAHNFPLHTIIYCSPTPIPIDTMTADETSWSIRQKCLALHSKYGGSLERSWQPPFRRMANQQPYPCFFLHEGAICIVRCFECSSGVAILYGSEP